MANPHASYEERKCAWQRWRDESGKKMKQKYERVVELSNEAARLNGKFLFFILILILATILCTVIGVLVYKNKLFIYLSI